MRREIEAEMSRLVGDTGVSSGKTQGDKGEKGVSFSEPLEEVAFIGNTNGNDVIESP